ncbi:putative ribonuclease H-like domain-containing protein [Tanacetum coccineum]
MCDKKHSVLFTETECLVLSPDFKLLDESQVLLKIPRQDNMHIFYLKNVFPLGDFTCLFAKATIDESNLWHRRLGHINFKTMNKLVKENLVRGLPSKLFENDHTCVACQKGKQHKASYLVGGFFTTKDETPGILKNFITGIEKQIDHKVKTIRCDNGTEFKNRIMNEFCEMKGRKSSLSFMRPFGCHVTILNTIDHLGNQTNGNAGTKKNIDAGQAEMNTVPGPQYVLLPFLTFDSQNPMSSEEEVADDAGKKNGVEGPAKEGDMNGPGEATNTNNTNKLNTISSPVNVDKDANSTYRIFTHVNAVGSSYENLGGSTPVNAATPSNDDYPTDHLMPDLEDTADPQNTGIFGNPYDDEDVGVEADLNNLETTISKARRLHQEEGIDYDEVFAPVARIEAVRLFLAYASFMGFIVYQIDVKSAFLYDTIEEEVYVCQTLGFEDSQFPNKVYKVYKALYGLHQAPRAWYETLSTYLIENRFRRGIIDKTLFIKKEKGDILLVQMSSMGELTFFLGLQVKQKNDGSFIRQDKYVADILKKFDFSSVKIASTPLETNKALTKDKEAEDVDVHLYRSMIGSLMYLTTSKPDIMFVVCTCARF